MNSAAKTIETVTGHGKVEADKLRFFVDPVLLGAIMGQTPVGKELLGSITINPGSHFKKTAGFRRNWNSIVSKICRAEFSILSFQTVHRGV